MFFLVAGIQPKTINLDDQPRICPACGLCQARLKRINHYLALFFIPVVRVKKGFSFLECGSCGGVFYESGEVGPRPNEPLTRVCPYCGETLVTGFRFCPYCGKKV